MVFVATGIEARVGSGGGLAGLRRFGLRFGIGNGLYERRCRDGGDGGWDGVGEIGEGFSPEASPLLRSMAFY